MKGYATTSISVAPPAAARCISAMSAACEAPSCAVVIPAAA